MYDRTKNAVNEMYRYLKDHPCSTPDQVAAALYDRLCKYSHLAQYRENPEKTKRRWAVKTLEMLCQCGLAKRVCRANEKGKLDLRIFFYEAVPLIEKNEEKITAL
jgi:hypothetical protein